MARDAKAEAALGLHRFGLGPRPGSIAGIASDPRGAVLSELDRSDVGRIDNPALPTSGAAARAVFEFQQERQRQQERMREERAQQPPMAPDEHPAAAPPAADAGRDDTGAPPAGAEARRAAVSAQGPSGDRGQLRQAGQIPGVPQQLYLDEAKARTAAALGAEVGFVERLVWFWSNHFCISADKSPLTRALCGAYEREAIRGHVLGGFGEMLLAAETHPGMLLYLDNVRSMGPRSPAGIRQRKGLNENLARETLELHTLGVRTGYTQGDVVRLAKVITGWTLTPFKQDPIHGGEFAFNARQHEPGDEAVIGTTYPDTGVEQGRAVLARLARHPATAAHIARKLARSFVADEPPPALVERLRRRFLDTDGNLKELARTLVMAPEAWDAPRDKLKPPGQWIVAALRAAAVASPDIGTVLQAHVMLGAPLWRPPAPNGFSDLSADWLSGLSERLDVANQIARRVAGLIDPQAVIDVALGPLATADTRHAIAGAESRPQSLALLLMSPEFQRS